MDRVARRSLLAGGGLAIGGALVSHAAPAAAASTAGGIYDVTDYGALGDGNHDDAAAIQSAVDAAAASPGGGVCLVPHGTFSIGRGIDVPAGAHLVIDGTLRLADHANQNILWVRGSNVLLEGIGTLDGNGASQSGTLGGIVNVDGITGVIVRGLTVRNVRNWGVNFTKCSNVLLEGMTFADNGNSNEFAAEATNCWARGCTITGTNDFGFAFYGGVTNSGITDSFAYGNSGPGIGILSDEAQPVKCENITIANCISYDNIAGQPGIAVITGPSITTPHRGVVISNNTTHGNAGAGILVADVEACVISGNNCHDDGQQELYLSAYNLSGNRHASRDIQVIGNSLANPGGDAGLRLVNSPDNFGPPPGTDAGTYLTDVSIAHNVIYADNGKMPYCLTGGPADRALIHGNIMRGWTTASSNYQRGVDNRTSDNTAPV